MGVGVGLEVRGPRACLVEHAVYVKEVLEHTAAVLAWLGVGWGRGLGLGLG